MISTKPLSIALLAGMLLAGCGGGGGAWDPDDDDDNNPADAPSAPVGLTSNVGDEAVSLGWTIPATNNTDTIEYQVSSTPVTSGAEYTVVGTTAFVRGLENGTTYTFSVTASNAAGTGPAASIQVKPATALVIGYSNLSVTGNGADRLADPAPLRTASGQIWMAYADVEENGSGQIVSSTIRLAQSNNNGASYSDDQEVAGTALAPGGRWHYRTPWLIEDSTDPDATRRFKLFAHKYLFNPNDSLSDYADGAISMWTAASPDGAWSEEIVLGWAETPVALAPPALVGQIDPALQPCLWIDQGSASVGADGIDMVFSCALDTQFLRKIVLLRSVDHAQSFTYVATLLQPTDAAEYDAESFDMPALLPGAGTAPILFASPTDIFGNAQGCVLFPIADAKAGKLFTELNAPLALQVLPPTGGDSSGGCGWDRSIPAGGILMNDQTGSDFTIQATGKSL